MEVTRPSVEEEASERIDAMQTEDTPDGNIYFQNTVGIEANSNLVSNAIGFGEDFIPTKSLKKHELEAVLEDYQNKFGSGYPLPITTTDRLQGKPTTSTVNPSTHLHELHAFEGDPQPWNICYEYDGEHWSCDASTISVIKDCHMKPKAEMEFRVDSPHFDDILLNLLNRRGSGFLTTKDMSALALVSKDHMTLVSTCNELRCIDFSALKECRGTAYKDQTEICENRVKYASACLLHFNGHPGMLVRYCGLEYTGERRDIDGTLAEIREHIDPVDYKDIERILREGCPGKMDRRFKREDKMKYLERGNCPSVENNKKKVMKTMNKEDKNSHLIPVSQIFCRFSPYIQHVPQTMNTKKEDDIRLCWNGSKMYDPDDTPMNMGVDDEEEPEITFGMTLINFMTQLYNQRISYPSDEIWLATADIKACFRFPKIHPDVTGAFSFVFPFMGHLFISTAMVFGFILSANCWEPFRRAIETMTKVYFTKFSKGYTLHKEYLEMISFDDVPNDEKFTKAVPCSINKGCLDENGNQKPIGGLIYVDDDLLCAPWFLMRQLLVSTIEAIFTLCGRPNFAVRQCPLALDKWKELVVGHKSVFLGVQFDARKLTVAITEGYTVALHDLLTKTWHKGRKMFSIKELAELLGKCARLGVACNWVYHLLTHLYKSAAFALRSNTDFLNEKSPRFKSYMKRIKELKNTDRWQESARDVAHINFATRKAAKLVHGSDNKYPIGKDMRAEIDFLTEATSQGAEVSFETPIAHMIKRDPSAVAWSDACLVGAGGYSVDLAFIWYLTWSGQIYKRTILFLEKNDASLVSINMMEFCGVIINYCAALTALDVDPDVINDPWPVLLAWCDNTSAVNWINQACTTSAGGRALGRFFCGLLMNSRLGINSRWLSTLENVVADDISRLKSEHMETNPDSQFALLDYQQLLQDHSQLKGCRRFVPSEGLILLLEQCMLNGSCPSQREIVKLRQAGLGRLITLHG